MDDLWYGTSGPHDARIAIVAESWGVEELSKQQPLVGTSGQEATRLLADAGINRFDCFVTNVVSRHPPGNDMKLFFHPTVEARKNGRQPFRGLYPRDDTLADIDRLNRQLASIRPRVIVAFGNYALWALTKCAGIGNSEGYKIPTGITSWRGSYLEWSEESSIPVIATFHPAAILRAWYWRTPAVHDLRMRVKPLSDGAAVPDPDHRFLVRPTFEQAVEALEHLQSLPSGSWITCDLETRHGHIACLGFGWSAFDAVCIPLLCIDRVEGYWKPDEEIAIRANLDALFASRDLRFSNQNILYDLQYIDKWLWTRPAVSHDTMLAHHLIWPGTPKDLSYLSSLYCRYHKYWKEDGRYWDAESMPEEQLWTYNCVDAVRTWEITQVLEGLIDRMEMRELFNERLDILSVSLDMMLRGIKIDMDERKRQALSCFTEIERLEFELDRMMPEHLRPLLASKSAKSPWYRSPTQQARLFYDLIGLDEIRNRKTGNRTLDDDAIGKLKLREPLLSDLFDGLGDLRSLGIFYNNFLTAETDPDHRMRCSFNPAGTITFRWSSSENAFGRGTNLQNLPKPKDHDI